MAQVTQLPYGAISPSAKPVSAYVEPKRRSIAGAPSAPATFGSPGQLSTVSTGGTTFVQGSNSFKQLANDLQTFNQNLVSTGSKAGLMFADWQMEQGEADAMEQIAEAQARLDEEVETSELNRAAANRQIATADPQAGGLMDLLNPYRRIGYQRGMAKQAGQEIEMGMGSYIAANGNFDYSSPDQGFGQLQQLRAQYTTQVLDKYGVDSSTPGFTKYVAPRIDKASDRAAQKLQKDRADYFDAQKPVAIASLIKSEWQNIQDTGMVTFNGQTITRDNPMFKQYVALRLNQITSNELLTSGLPGQAREWSKGAYEILAAERDYNGDAVSPLDYLYTKEPIVGADGKQATDAFGNPRFYSWNDMFSVESIDSRIKYGEARFRRQQRERTELAQNFEGQLIEETKDIAAGAQRQAVGKAALDRLIAEEDQRRLEQGLPPLTAADKAPLYQAWSDANEQTLELTTNPSEDPTLFIQSVRGSYGTDFDPTAVRNRAAVVAAGLQGKDKKAFLDQVDSVIKEKETSEDVQANYGTTFNPMITTATNAFVAREYGTPRRSNAADRATAEGNFVTRLNLDIQAALKAEEGKLDRRLSQAEARQVAQKVIDGLKPEELGDLAPNGATQKAQQEREAIIQSQIESGQPEPTPPTPTYDTNGLADIPNRQVVLRQFRTVPVLSEQAITDAVTQPVAPIPLKKAWRDAGAANLYDFIEAQVNLLKQQNPGWEPSWTPAQWRQLRDRSLQSAGLEKSIFTTRQLTASRPQLASIQGWIVPTLLEV